MSDSVYFDIADRILAIARQIRHADADAKSPITSLESSVMRFIDTHPGASAKAAAEASLLTSSNFSRALRSLEAKGYVRREPDPHDARSVRLHPTQKAAENRRWLHERWGTLLRDRVPDETAMELAAHLALLEAALVAKRPES